MVIHLFEMKPPNSWRILTNVTNNFGNNYEFQESISNSTSRGNGPQLGCGSQSGSLFCEMTAGTCKVQTPSRK